MTPEEFLAHLTKVINNVRGDRNFDQLSWANRKALSELDDVYKKVIETLESK